ncbi:MAG: LemA family protein [Actinobacteria bacterium]|nr:LemA family protein [Actinomycetota bacterium]
MPLIAAAILAGALGVWIVVTFNRLVRARNRVREAWAQIDVQLAQRADLAPRLVAAVEGYRRHEADTLDRVVAARGEVMNAAGPVEAGRADDRLEGALTRLYALAEAYPELKADQTFLDLQARLTALEEDIASARRYYNALVERYATLRQTFPNNAIAAPAGFRAAEYFKASAGEERVPEVTR